jgi:hypothetical protein
MDSTQKTKPAISERGGHWERYRIVTADLPPTTYALPESYSIGISLDPRTNRIRYDGFIGLPADIDNVVSVPSRVIETIPSEFPTEADADKHDKVTLINLIMQYLVASLDYQKAQFGEVSVVDQCSYMILQDCASVAEALAELDSYHRRHYAYAALAGQYTAALEQLFYDTLKVRARTIVGTR